MIYHKQKQFGQKGSCYPTVLACLLDLSLEEVPNFNNFYWTGEEHDAMRKVFEHKWETQEWRDHNYSIAINMWHNSLTYWLASRGYIITVLPQDGITKWVEDHKDIPYMVSGITSRGLQHIAIYKNGILHHDPHPDDEGIMDDSNRLYEILEKII
jgi:hypothetical protein